VRTLDAAITAAKNATSKCVVLLCEITTSSGVLYYANCMDNIIFPVEGR